LIRFTPCEAFCCGHVEPRDLRAEQLGDHETGRIVRAAVDPKTAGEPLDRLADPAELLMF
jgi:hypothetical protein